jgi:hypothetical protein
MNGTLYLIVESFNDNFDMFDNAKVLWKNDQRFFMNPCVNNTMDWIVLIIYVNVGY